MYFYQSLTSSDIEDNLTEFKEDCLRIHKVLNEQGFNITPFYACALWMLYSSALCAQFMSLPIEDEHIIYFLNKYVFE